MPWKAPKQKQRGVVWLAGVDSGNIGEKQQDKNFTLVHTIPKSAVTVRHIKIAATEITLLSPYYFFFILVVKGSRILPEPSTAYK